MAGHWRLVLIAAAVVLGHALLINWLRSQMWRLTVAPPVLAAPMLTRTIEPVVAPVQVKSIKAKKPTVPRNPQAQAAINSVALIELEKTLADVPAAPEPEPQSTQAEAPPAPEIVSPPEPLVTNAAAEVTAPAGAIDSWGDWPGDTRIRYRLSGYFNGALDGSAEVLWQRDGPRYQVQVKIWPFPFVSFTFLSQGDVTPEGLRPQTYLEELRRRPRRVSFAAETIRLDDGRELPRPPQTQDAASQFVQLAQRFASGQDPLTPGAVVKLWLARPGGIDQWIYDIGEPETLQTPRLGAVTAFPLTPRPIANPRGSIVAQLWFAPSLRYLPVRVRISLDAQTYVDLLVDRVEQR